MANIKQYTSPVDGIRPDETGSAAYEMEGRHIGAAFNEIGHQVGGAIDNLYNKVDQHDQQQDIASLSNLAAQTFMKNTATWNSKMSGTDPATTDPSKTQTDFMSNDLEKSLSDLQGAATTDAGRKWVEQFANEQRMHFAEKTSADVSTASGIAIQSNLTQAFNNYSSAAYADPTALPTVVKNMDATVEANISAHALNPAEASRLREWYSTTGRKNAAIAAARGSAERNPDQFKADLAGGKYADYFSGDETATLDKEADSYKRAQLEGVKAQDEVKRKQEDDNFGRNMTNLYSSQIDQQSGNVRVQPDFFSTLIKLGQQPGSERHVGELKAMGDWAQKEIKDAGTNTVSDPHVYDDFRSRMTLPPTDPHTLTPTQVFQARANGTLSEKDFQFFRSAPDAIQKDPNKAFAEKRFNDFLASQKPSFIPKENSFSLTGGDPKDNQKWYTFQHDARDAFENAYTQNKWQDVLDPHNKAFLGHMGAQSILNQKGAAAGGDAYGTVVMGKKFIGHTTADWHNPKMWANP